jgi:hypothetical protein
LSKDTLTIWQQNLNKSPTSQHDLISSNKLTQIGIDIVALQEPAINAFNCTVASRDWMTVYVTALPLDVTGLYMVLRIPTTIKVGHAGIVTVKLLIITL